MYKIIKEGEIKIKAPKETKISKKLPVFYNPIMKFNRDISIILLNSIEDDHLRIALPLAASGIRGLRFLKELDKGKINEIHLNDYEENFKKKIDNNLKLNKLKKGKLKIKNKDANLFLLESSGFDYIDIDPFGTPNPFLDSAIKRISRGGILAVTATDTAALSGTYKNSTKRKYWANPLHNELMHEAGIRILIRKIQLIGAQYDKALTPIFSYFKDHYYRIFFKCKKGKTEVDNILKHHAFFNGGGPMWIGNLWDPKIVGKMIKKTDDKNTISILNKIKDESHINIVGFYDIHAICKENKIKKIPKKEEIIKNIKKLGYKVSVTHFTRIGLKSNIEKEKLIKIINQQHV